MRSRSGGTVMKARMRSAKSDREHCMAFTRVCLLADIIPIVKRVATSLRPRRRRPCTSKLRSDRFWRGTAARRHARRVRALPVQTGAAGSNAFLGYGCQRCAWRCRPNCILACRADRHCRPIRIALPAPLGYDRRHYACTWLSKRPPLSRESQETLRAYPRTAGRYAGDEGARIASFSRFCGQNALEYNAGHPRMTRPAPYIETLPDG